MIRPLTLDDIPQIPRLLATEQGPHVDLTAHVKAVIAGLMPLLFVDTPHADPEMPGLVSVGGQLTEILEESQPSVILAARVARPVLEELFAAHLLCQQVFAAVPIGTLEALPIAGQHFATAFSGIDVLQKPAEPLACRATTNSPALHFYQSGEMASDVGNSSGSPIYKATEIASGSQNPTIVSHSDVFAFLEESLLADDLMEFDRIAVAPLLSPLAAGKP